MTKIICVGDIHVSDRAPASATETYTDDIIAILRWVADYAAEIDADAVVWAGDVFHHKAPSRNSHELVLKMIDVVKYHRVPLLCVTGNHDCCVLEDTRALTDKGWRGVSELDGSERFATMNKETLQIEWQFPTAIHRMHYQGQGYSFQSSSVDLVTTPNHAFWGTDGHSFGKKPLLRKLASDVYRGFSVPSRGVLVGGTADTVDIGGREVPLLVAARLFGWYVAEGTADRTGSRFTISQSRAVNPDHYAEITALIEEAGFIPVGRDKMIRVNDRPMTEFLIEHFGYSGSKDMRIPTWLWSWPQEARLAFLYAYFRGDGTIGGSKEERALADYSSSSVQARTANLLLAEDLLAVASLSGYKASRGVEKEYPFGDTEYVGHAYSVSFSQKQKCTTLSKGVPVKLDAEVWCPELPNGTWLALRNGKTCWTGNSNGIVDHVHERQPLGVLYAAGLQELNGWHPTLPLFGVPWRETWTAPGDPALALAGWREDSELVSERGQSLVVTHAPIYPPSLADNPMFELVPLAGPDGLSAAMGNTGFLYYGHIHEDHGVFDVEGVTYANVGAVSRGSLHEYNLERQIKVAVWSDGDPWSVGPRDTEAPVAGFTEVVVPHKPASEVFRIAEVMEERGERLSLEHFLSEVGARTLEISSTGTVIAHIRDRNDVSESVKKRAIEILEEVS